MKKGKRTAVFYSTALVGVAVNIAILHNLSPSYAQESNQDDALLVGDINDDVLLTDDLPDDALTDDEDIGDEEDVTDADYDAAADAHLALFAENRYPSANTCKVCHENHYKEWSVSQHAYAQLSPIYMAMQNRINQLSNGSNGDFCIRCHNQVGMNIGESTYVSNLERHPTSREGITCVVCHRVKQPYGKVSGRIALVEGDLLTTVYGPTGDEELKRVLDNRDKYRVVTEEGQSGRQIHTKVGHFPQIQTSQFCGSCHDVNLFNGFRLEEAFSEYKNSPAARRGVSCQDCHMGKVQGAESEYAEGPAAIVGGEPTRTRKLTNHYFAGPDYSVIHPGIFPHNSDAAEMATLEEWLQFDAEAGWGTDAFEDNVGGDYEFPARWRSIDDRYDARAIIDDQQELLDWATAKRLEVLRSGYKLGEIDIRKKSAKGLVFEIPVSNGTDGHNAPTGFDAERLLWLEVTVRNENGDVLFKSGDLDPNGDLRDAHSLYVHNGKSKVDKFLFNLQSKFLTRSVRGGEREQVLAINYSADATPFVRPFTRSLMLTGQPDGARKHRRTIAPLATRVAKYKVNKSQLAGAKRVTIEYKLKSGAVPVNLVHEISPVGFDYGMSARDVADNLIANHQVIWENQITVDL